LKKHELHPIFKREGKNFLCDIYYDESQMNKWRDSCVRTQDSVKVKLEKLHREIHQQRIKLTQSAGEVPQNIDDQKVKDLQEMLESLMQE